MLHTRKLRHSEVAIVLQVPFRREHTSSAAPRPPLFTRPRSQDPEAGRAAGRPRAPRVWFTSFQVLKQSCWTFFGF